MNSRQGSEKNGLNKTRSTTGTKDNDNTVGEASKNARSGGAGSSSSTTSYDWQQVFGSFRKKLQRHPSSYEREPDDDVTPEQATAKVNYGSKKRSLTVDIAEKPLLKQSPTDKIDEIEDTFIYVEDTDAASQLVPQYCHLEFPPEESGAKKRPQRQPPSLARTPRIESDTEPIEKEKILKLLKNTVMSVCFSEEPKKDEAKTPDDKPEPECPSPMKIDFDYRRLSRNVSEKTIASLIQERTPDKETASSSRTWIPKSVSKILSDNKSSVANITEKKRAKSPSSILEYAQRKLPKWAAFSRKSDEEACVEYSKSKDESASATPPKLGHTSSHSIEELEQPVTVTLKQPSFSDNEDAEKSNKTLCRWFVSDEEHPTVDPNAEGTSKLTKTLSCEPLGSAYTNVKPSFSFFKNKECKYNKLKQKAEQKQKNRKGEKIIALDTTERNCDLRKAKSDAGDYRKISSDVKVKSTVAKEKGKFFSKQKSKDKSAGGKETSPTVRKNSMKFGTLKNLWFKGNRDKSLLVDSKIKATSAEALEFDRIHHHSDQEFLLSSLQVFLAVSPTSAKLQVKKTLVLECKLCALVAFATYFYTLIVFRHIYKCSHSRS